MAKPVKNNKDLLRVASISANNDEEIGAMIAEAFDKVGQDGCITISEADGEEDTLVLTEGFEIPRGAFSERFLKGEVSREFQNANILVYDGKIEDQEKISLSEAIGHLEEFTNSEKQNLFDLMNGPTLPELTKNDTTFSSKERSNEVIEKLTNLALTDGEIQAAEKEFIDRVKNMI